MNELAAGVVAVDVVNAARSLSSVLTLPRCLATLSALLARVPRVALLIRVALLLLRVPGIAGILLGRGLLLRIGIL
jgi:hypothetical protein